MSLRTDAGFIDRQNRILEHASPSEILDLAMYVYAPRIAISTAFGVEGCAMVHMAQQISPDIEVFTVDTGVLFDETLALKDELIRRYGVKIRTFTPELTLEEQAREHGDELWTRDTERCCAIRKVEPTRRALAGLDCWIAGLRRDQSASRKAIRILERYEAADGKAIVKVHPLANWTRADTWKYVLDNDVPYNPLLDQGYRSIGCKPCTAPVSAGDSERAGRWGGSKDECGIHTMLTPAHDLVRKQRA